MASRVYLHIGLPKTGTSYLQAILRGNMAALTEQGVLLPGPRGSHYLASLDVRGLSDSPGLRANADQVRGSWRQLVEETQAWPGTVLFTNELFAGASVKSIARIVEDLSPAEVHVIVAVRDLARALPAAWQQSVKSGRRMSLDEYISRVRDRGPRSAWFRKAQFPERVLARWQQHVPKERIHVITVPPSGSPRDVLWERFSEVLGIAPDSCALTPTVNESMGAVEAELLWRVNVHLVPRLEQKQISMWVRDELGNDILARSGHPRRLAIPEEAWPWVLQRSRVTIRQLGRGGYDIRGDLEELDPSTGAGSARAPATVEPDEVLDAATQTIAELVVRLRDTRRRAIVARRRGRRARARRLIGGRRAGVRRRLARRLVRRLRRAPAAPGHSRRPR